MKRDLRLLLNLWPHARPDAWVFVFALVATPAIAVLSLAQPWLIKRIIDDHVVAGEINGLAALALLYLAAVAAGYLIEALHVGDSLGRDATDSEIETSAVLACAALRQRFFDRQPAGKLLTRLTSDLDSLGDALSAGIVTIVLDMMMIVGTVAAMFWLDWRLSVLMMLLTPILLGTLEFLRRRMKVLYLEIRDALASINAYLAERIDGVPVIQLFGAESTMLDAFETRNRRFRDRHLAPTSSIHWPMRWSMVWARFSWRSCGRARNGRRGCLDAFGKPRSAGLLVAFIDYMQRHFDP